jgi:hypothetical protein
MGLQISVFNFHELGFHKTKAFFESRPYAQYISEIAERMSAILDVGGGGDTHAKISS